VILPAENRQNVEEDLTPDQTDGVTIHYAKTIDDVLAVALPKSTNEQQRDREVREQVIEHATA
jgi:ATP-dependent Lon protease